MINPHIVRKSTSPVAAPPEAGIHWINIVTNEEFFSVGTTSVNDWVKRINFADYNVEYFTVNLSQEIAKEIQLSGTPSYPTKTLLDIAEGGGTRIYSVDYTVTGDKLSWSGLRLDGLLESGDEVRVIWI